MNLAPGGILWLLSHELRLTWYGAAAHARSHRRPGTATLALWAAGWIFLHVAAWGLLAKLGPAAIDDPALALPVTALLLVSASFMLSTALKASVLALFERGDLDLLLSSPLPSLSIFAVRLLGVAGASAGLFLYILAPFAHVALVLGHPRWLALYPALGAMALLSACAAMLLTLALVRVIGARRTRVLGQVLAAFAGGLLFLLFQSLNFVASSRGTDLGALAQRVLAAPRLGPASLAWLPGRAALGDAPALLGLAALAAAAFALTVARTHRFFVHGLQLAAGIGRAAPAPPGGVRLRIRHNLFDTVVAKEWRSIVRAPHLISQVLLQLVYLLPLMLPIMRGKGAPEPALAASLTMLCGSLTGGLAWIIISAEEAPDLLRSAPAALRTVRLAKLAAATMPSLLLAAVPLLWLVVRAPVAGLLASFTTTAAILGTSVVVQWAGRPAPRSDFGSRARENLLCSMLELLGNLCWSGLAWSLIQLAGKATGSALAGASACLAGAFLVLALAWGARPRPS